MQTYTLPNTTETARLSTDRPDRASRKAPRAPVKIGKDVFVALMLAVFVIFGCFHRTVITGTPISKLAELAELDTFFGHARYSVYRPKSDPSLFQFHVPFQIFNEQVNKAGQIPLWNPNNGCGFPVIGELQYCIFSPFRFIFRASEPYLYNLGIVLKATTAVVGAFAFARLLGVSIIGSLLVSTAYGFCPFVLRELELPNEVELLPVTCAVFLSLGFKKSLMSRAGLGIFSVVALTTMHPEFFFLNMVMGAALVLLISIFWKAGSDNTDTANSIVAKPTSVMSNLFIAGSIGFALGAPLLFSFIDLLCHGKTYKFGEFTMQYVPVQTFLASMTHPAFGGGSPFMGILATVLTPLALFVRNSRVRALMVIAAVAFIASTVPGPFHSIAQMKPFCLVPPRYCLAPLLLALAALAGFGLDHLMRVKPSPKERTFLVFTLGAIAFLSVPVAIFQLKLNSSISGFDGTLPPAMVTSSALSRDFMVTVAALTVVFVLSIVRIPYRAAVLAIALVALNLVSLLPVTRVALSPMPSFTYPDHPLLKFLSESGERVLPVSRFFFLPNVSMAYGIRDLRYTGPICLDREPNFAWLCLSSEARRAKAYLEHPMLAKAIDLASVKYILSRVPVLSTEDKPFIKSIELPGLAKKPVRVSKDLALTAARLSIDATSRAVIMQLNWQMPASAEYDYILEPVLVDDTGKEIQASDRHPIARMRAGRRLQTVTIGIPPGVTPDTPVNAAVRIYSRWTDSDLWPEESSLKTIGSRIILQRFTLADFQTKEGPSAVSAQLPESRFKLIRQTKDGMRIYENRTALPQAYFVSNAIHAMGGEDAFAAIAASGFSPRNTVVLEDAPYIPAALAAPDIVPARVTRPSPNQVSIRVDAPRDGWLVLTDSYYPGWHATVDGEETKILRANYAFRAVPVKQGTHQIEFTFFPDALKLGLMAALSCIGALLLAFAIKAARKN